LRGRPVIPGVNGLSPDEKQGQGEMKWRRRRGWQGLNIPSPELGLSLEDDEERGRERDKFIDNQEVTEGR
jgi:hypothetical protein